MRSVLVVLSPTTDLTRLFMLRFIKRFIFALILIYLAAFSLAVGMGGWYAAQNEVASGGRK